MSQIPSVLAFLASVVGTGTALVPAVFDRAQEAPAGAAFTGFEQQPVQARGWVKPLRPGAVTVRRDDDGLFYMPARVNGIAVRFLLDSGANMVILPKDLARAAGVPEGRGSGQARTVGGAARFSLSSASRIEAAGRTLQDVPVAVAMDSSAPPLLGMNALTRMGRITMARDEMIFEPGGPNPTF